MSVEVGERVPIAYASEERVEANEDSRQHTKEKSIDDDVSASFNFFLLAATAEALGVISIIVVGIWMSHYRGGFAWDGSAKEFNYHPLFMVLGLVFLYGNGSLVYRVLRKTEKTTVKIIHAVLQVSALILAIAGLKAVFDFHNGAKIPNMYSLHSWLGIITVVLFCFQWLFGFLAFLLPKFSDEYRTLYLKIHQYFGIGMIVLAITTCLLGITEKLIFSVKNYSQFPAEGVLANTLGLLLVGFGVLVIYIITKPEYRRQPESQHLYSAID